DHGVDLGVLVLQREITMAGGRRPAEAGDLAADPDMAVGVLHRPLQRGGELGDGIFGRVGKLFGGHHWRFAVLGCARKLGTFGPPRQPRFRYYGIAFRYLAGTARLRRTGASAISHIRRSP